eukprot:CAMPEP_0113658918 /NCGR_PEP_ID=MMETSP0017_2-20120614/32038_1 /TAXON_ID=2856 /ORGANISM="Cylindrotheca closterium" /LENGTH=69 /DNA_ID=CAMNT_0000573349 /DNA_START=295 /DNA_END=504 /DNA_ORIENTATION=+ /assembly_acc=CAM_ASM_000147
MIVADKILGPLYNGGGFDDDESTGAPVGSVGAGVRAIGGWVEAVGDTNEDEGILDRKFESMGVGAGVAP